MLKLTKYVTCHMHVVQVFNEECDQRHERKNAKVNPNTKVKTSLLNLCIIYVMLGNQLKCVGYYA